MRFRGCSTIIALAGCGLFVLAPFAAGARAASIIKCVGADGSVAFQEKPCAAHQRQSEVTLAPAPPMGPAPVYALDLPAPAQRTTRHRMSAKRKAPMSWECRAADGQVFYRHTRCPGSVPTDGHGESRRGTPFTQRGNRVRVKIAAQSLSREEACRQIHSGGSTARRGHDYDEEVSAYEHNLGRDPCL